MESSTTAAPSGSADGTNAQGKRNLGRIEEIQGVVIEATFPERLPEINHAITIQRTASNEEEEQAGVSSSGRAHAAVGGSVTASACESVPGAEEGAASCADKAVHPSAGAHE